MPVTQNVKESLKVYEFQWLHPTSKDPSVKLLRELTKFTITPTDQSRSDMTSAMT